MLGMNKSHVKYIYEHGVSPLTHSFLNSSCSNSCPLSGTHTQNIYLAIVDDMRKVQYDIPPTKVASRMRLVLQNCVTGLFIYNNITVTAYMEVAFTLQV